MQVLCQINSYYWNKLWNKQIKIIGRCHNCTTSLSIFQNFQNMHFCLCLCIISFELKHTTILCTKMQQIKERKLLPVYFSKYTAKCMHQSTARLISEEKKKFFWNAENHYFRKEKKSQNILMKQNGFQLY